MIYEFDRLLAYRCSSIASVSQEASGLTMLTFWSVFSVDRVQRAENPLGGLPGPSQKKTSLPM